MRSISRLWAVPLLGILVSTTACHDKDAPPAPPPSFTVGGTVAGLTGSVTLTNSGGDARTVTANGSFSFATQVAGNTAYSVAVSAQPANQTCTVTAGSGTVNSANVTSVAVNCVTDRFSVGGTLSGLSGNVTLANNGGDNLTRNADGTFTFATTLATAAAYNITVATQPANQTCTVANGTGNVAAANITSISVSCATYRVVASIGAAGGTVTHPDGAEVIIPAGALAQAIDIGVARSPAGWPTIESDLPTPSGAIYEFTPHGQFFQKPVVIRMPAPAGVSNPHTMMASLDLGWHEADVVPNGTKVEMERNTFSWAYTGACAGINSPPDPHFCSYPSGSAFATATPANSIIKTSNGLPALTLVGSAGTWNVDLNSVTSVNLTMSYQAPPDCASGSVTLKKWQSPQPPLVLADQPATLVNGRGTHTVAVPASNFADGINVFAYSFRCKRPNWNSPHGGADIIAFNGIRTAVGGFTVGGSVSGLSGAGLELQNGNREILAVPANSSTFVFTTPQIAGSSFFVRVRTQPAGANCLVANNSGTVSGNVTSIAVTCTPTQSNTAGFAIVANSNSNNFSLYSIQQLSGRLTPLGTTTSGSLPTAVAIAPNGIYTYVANGNGNSISAYRVVDPGAGSFQAIAAGSVSVPSPTALAIEPVQGRFLWSTSFGSPTTVKTFAINPTTGALTATDSVATDFAPRTIAAHPNGRFVYVAGQATNAAIAMYQVNATTGALTSIGSLSNITRPGISQSLAIAPSGQRAYVMDSLGTIARLTVNSTTGQMALSGFTPVNGASNGFSLVVHPTEKFLFATSSNVFGSSVHVYSIDATTGNLTILSTTTATPTSTSTLAINRGGDSLYVTNLTANTVTLFRVDSATGALTLIESQATGSQPLAVAVSTQ
jgi:6-phosphogluconolactonase (cycloisomerase 2 family)